MAHRNVFSCGYVDRVSESVPIDAVSVITAASDRLACCCCLEDDRGHTVRLCAGRGHGALTGWRMSLCVGLSIGAVNSVTASVSPARSRPSVRTRRTALTLDDHGATRVGNLPRFEPAVTDFADLARDPEPFVLGGRLHTAPGLVATVVRELLDTGEPIAGAVVTYPAVYSDKQVALLRQALDLEGLREAIMVPEPVAAAEWLEVEHGPLEPGFALVYDLGGASLDVTVVRVGPDWSDHPIVGNPRRCYDFGGRPLGATIARY